MIQTIDRIGFDAKRLFHNRTGLGNYSRTLVRNLRKYHPEVSIYLFTPSVSDHDYAAEFIESDDYIIVTPPKYGSKSYWRSHGITKQIQELKIDIYHGLSNALPLKRVDGTRYIVTIHDVIYKTHPEGYTRIDTILYDSKTKKAIANADQIIAISEATKTDLLKYYDVNESKITVLYQSCGWQYVPYREVKKHGLLFVSSLTHRKNLITLLKAMNRLKTTHPQELLVIGSGKAGLAKAKAYVKQHGLNEAVLFIENVGDDDILGYYENAEILVYPSLKEGFGIPIIEALSSGTQVITTGNSAMSEAGGELAHYLSDPTDDVEMADLILKVNALQPLPTVEINPHLSQFAAETTTHNLVKVYESLIA